MDSSVGIATRYGLDCLGSNPSGRRDFPHLSRPALGPTQPPVQWVPGVYRKGGGKRPRRDVDHPSPSSTEVTERVEVYLHSLSGSSWPEVNFTCTFVPHITDSKDEFGEILSQMYVGLHAK